MEVDHRYLCRVSHADGTIAALDHVPYEIRPYVAKIVFCTVTVYALSFTL